MTYLTSDPEYQERARQLQERRERWRNEDLRLLMNQPWGRRLAYYIIFELGRLEAASFEADFADGQRAVLHMARNEGIREMASVFKDLISQADSDKYMLMLAEEINSRQTERAIEHTAELRAQKEHSNDDGI